MRGTGSLQLQLHLPECANDSVFRVIFEVLAVDAIGKPVPIAVEGDSHVAETGEAVLALGGLCRMDGVEGASLKGLRVGEAVGFLFDIGAQPGREIREQTMLPAMRESEESNDDEGQQGRPQSYGQSHLLNRRPHGSFPHLLIGERSVGGKWYRSGSGALSTIGGWLISSI